MKRRYRRHIGIIAGGVVLLAAAGTLAQLTGLADFEDWLSPGTKEWSAHTRRAAELADSKSWAQLLEQVTVTDRLLTSEKRFAKKHAEVLPELMSVADEAVRGLLDGFDKGQRFSSEETTRLLASLDYLIERGSAGTKKLLLLAVKLHLGLATTERGITAVEALRRYTRAFSEKKRYRQADSEQREFVASLKPDLESLIDKLASDFTAERALTPASELIAELEKLTVVSISESPNTLLLLKRLKSDQSRKNREFGDALQYCIEAVTSQHATEDWKEILRADLGFVLDDLSDAAGVAFSDLEDTLSRAAEDLETPAPYMILAENASSPGAKFGWYYSAEKLGNLEAKAQVGMFVITQGKGADGKELTPDQKRIKGERRVRESADGGDPVGLLFLARLRMEHHEKLNREADYPEALRLARLAKEKGHPDAEAYERKAKLKLAEKQ